MEHKGFEPSTSSMPWRRAPNCANAPCKQWNYNRFLPLTQELFFSHCQSFPYQRYCGPCEKALCSVNRKCQTPYAPTMLYIQRSLRIRGSNIRSTAVRRTNITSGSTGHITKFLSALTGRIFSNALPYRKESKNVFIQILQTSLTMNWERATRQSFNGFSKRK